MRKPGQKMLVSRWLLDHYVDLHFERSMCALEDLAHEIVGGDPKGAWARVFSERAYCCYMAAQYFASLADEAVFEGWLDFDTWKKHVLAAMRGSDEFDKQEGADHAARQPG